MASFDLTDPYDRLLLVLAIRDEAAAEFVGQPDWEPSNHGIALRIGDLAQIGFATETQQAPDGTNFWYPLAVMCQWGAAYVFKSLPPYQVDADAIRAAGERFMARLSLGPPAHGLIHGNARVLLAFDGMTIPSTLDGGCDLDVLNRLRANLAADGRAPLDILRGRQPSLTFASKGALPHAPAPGPDDPLAQMLRLHSLVTALEKRERDGPVRPQPAATHERGHGFWLGGTPPPTTGDALLDNEPRSSPPTVAEQRAARFWRDVSATAALSRLAPVGLASTPEGHAEACLALLDRVQVSLPAPERRVLATALAPIAGMQHNAIEFLAGRVRDQRSSASRETGRWLSVLTAVEQDVHEMLGGEASTSRLESLQTMSAVHSLAVQHRSTLGRGAGLA